MKSHFREVRLILPTKAANTVARPGTSTVQQRVEFDLKLAFLGFTRTAGEGAWIDDNGAEYEEPVLIYDVAIPSGQPLGERTIERIIADVFRWTNEQGVYYRDPRGVVHILTRPIDDDEG